MNPQIIILTPRGRLDAAGIRPIESELLEHLEAGRTQILVDMSDVAYISSVGLRMFLTIMRGARKRGGALKLCGLNPRVMEIFRLAGFDRILRIVESREQAQSEFENGSEGGDS